MKTFCKAVWLLSAFCLLNGWHQVRAYEAPTHRVINEYLAKNEVNGFSLNSHLTDELGFPAGIEDEFEAEWGTAKWEETRKVWNWIEKGGEWEDSPPKCLPFLRAFNHFHDPLTDRGFALFLEWDSARDWFDLPERSQDRGSYSWHDVRNHFRNALTMSDKSMRDDAFADTFRGLGQLMHLVEDMSVPSHTRYDAHIWHNYEKWAIPNVKTDKLPTYSPFVFFDESPIGEITHLFDTDKYKGGDTKVTHHYREVTSDSGEVLAFSDIGLSEYTNANFLSNDTIPCIPPSDAQYPSPTLDGPVEEHEAPSGGGDVRKYYMWTDKRGRYRLATVPFAKEYYDEHLGGIMFERKCLPASLDDGVYEDYAKRLIPRAVGYGSQVLSHFFRGRIDMVPAETGDTYLICNNSDEEMHGRFTLFYDRKWRDDRRSAKPFGEIGISAGDTHSVRADFVAPPGMRDPGRYLLVFRGRLGEEEEAVAGKHPVPVGDYLHVSVGVGGDRHVVVWDLNRDRPASIRDNKGDDAEFPCPAGEISIWRGGTRPHEGTEAIWSIGEPADRLDFVAEGLSARPEDWNVVDHGYATERKHIEGELESVVVEGGKVVKMCCWLGDSPDPFVSQKFGVSTGDVISHECDATSCGICNPKLHRDKWETTEHTEHLCKEESQHAWGGGEFKRESTEEVRQDVEVTKSYGVVAGLGCSLGGVESAKAVFDEEENVTVSPKVTSTWRNLTVDDDAVRNCWGTNTLVCQNGSGVDSLIRTSYSLDILEINSLENGMFNPDGPWLAKSSGEVCEIKELGDNRARHESRVGGVMRGTETYKFYTHFGQLGNDVVIHHVPDGRVDEGTDVRQVVTLSSGRSLAQVFLYHFSIKGYEGAYEERRTYVHA